MNTLSSKARMVATIFEILAWVVLGLGALSAIVYFIAALSNGDFWAGIIVAGGIAVYSIVSWACISLAGVIAEYIEHRA